MMDDAEADRNEWVRLPWDSEHFGFPIARLLPRSLPEQRLSEVLRSVEVAGIRCLYWLTETSDSQLEVARGEAFENVDVRVELGIQLDPEALRAGPATIRVAEEPDLGPLKILAAKSHRNTRFYTGAFPMDRADALYSAWIEGSFFDPAQVVLVSGPPGLPDGYLAAGMSERGVGSIGLIAVEESRREMGLGSDLVSAALARFARDGASQATVVTQGSNLAGLRLYERLGFSERDRSMWLHKWFG